MSPARAAAGPCTRYQTDNFLASKELANLIKIGNQMHGNTEDTTEIRSMQTESKMDARAGRYVDAKAAWKLPGESG